MDQYLIGSKTRLELDVTVKNAGEDAFESMFYLQMPLGINYVNLNKAKMVWCLNISYSLSILPFSIIPSILMHIA